MKNKIMFNKTASFLGRNGCFKSVGIVVFRSSDGVNICPITSKGEIARCKIEVPECEIDSFCELLQDFKNETN